MKTLTKYIKEGLIGRRVSVRPTVNYKYHPISKDQLIDIIIDLFDKNITDLNCIDTSMIGDMSELFSFVANKRKKLNPSDIKCGLWNVSNVENMRGMFKYYKKFNCYLGDWNVSNVKDMTAMFLGCELFNQSLSGWDTSNVENMAFMFKGCKNFDSDLSTWNVSKVKKFDGMFQRCEKFDCNLSEWDTQIQPNIEKVNVFFGTKSMKDENKPKRLL